MFDKDQAVDAEARIVGAAPIVEKLQADLRKEVRTYRRRGLKPKLKVLLVGDQPASVWYARNKARVGAKVGLAVDVVELPSSTSEAEVVDLQRPRTSAQDAGRPRSSLPRRGWHT